MLIFKVILQVSRNCLFLQDLQKGSEATEGLVQKRLGFRLGQLAVR
jgi:hypothetical protein